MLQVPAATPLTVAVVPLRLTVAIAVLLDATERVPSPVYVILNVVVLPGVTVTFVGDVVSTGSDLAHAIEHVALPA
jgi:hypothetical protein